MIPYKSPLLTAVPRALEKRLEIVNAARALLAQEDERFRERRAEIAALRRDLEGLRHECGKLAETLREAFQEWVLTELRAQLRRYSSDQPRVPAGSSQGGQWTSEGGNGSAGISPSDTARTPDGSAGQGTQYAPLDTETRTDATEGDGTTAASNTGVQVAAGTVTPSGLIFQQVPAPDPLDPQRLNRPLSLEEQQQVADALNLIFNGNASGLNSHAYRNLPHDVTGAVLPQGANGYTAYDVPGIGAGRGERRLLVDKGTGAIYYTNNHYKSFYPVQVNVHGE